MSAILQVDNLETAYGTSQVLFGVSFSIEQGEMATLLGRNGMGKTTTVRSIMGLTAARGGTISFRGERIEQRATDRIARMEDGRIVERGSHEQLLALNGRYRRLFDLQMGAARENAHAG